MTESPDSRGAARRLVLVRHGRSAHLHRGWLDEAGFRSWRRAYEAASILDSERPPPPLESVSSAADLLVASDAPRALATARLLAHGRDVTISPLLRELSLGGPALGRVRLPFMLWAVAVAVRMLALSALGRFPSERDAKRIRDGAGFLDGLAREHPLIVVVTHGAFRRAVTTRLVQLGWETEPGRRSWSHWSAWTLTHRG